MYSNCVELAGNEEDFEAHDLDIVKTLVMCCTNNMAQILHQHGDRRDAALSLLSAMQGSLGTFEFRASAKVFASIFTNILTVPGVGIHIARAA